MAAAAEILRGHALYRDVSFDKPPLYAYFYVLAGTHPGWLLRAAGTVLVLFSSWLAYLLGSRAWGRQEGVLAATFLALGLTFWIPAAVIAVAPDVLMIAPHIAAVYFAHQKRAFACGLCCGLGLLCNLKGALILPACALWLGSRVWVASIAASVPVALAAASLPVREMWQQVIVWGFAYSRDTFVNQPLAEGLRRFASWSGFHAAVVLGCAFAVWRERNWRWAGWVLICAAGVVAGLRFFPRYFFQLLVPVSILGARGVAIMPPWARALTLSLLFVPAIRFGPRYARLNDIGWADTAMMNDSRSVAALLDRTGAPRSRSLLVWGYRPDIYVFSERPAGTPFLESQPLTGVLADRHLIDSRPTAPGVAVLARSRLTDYKPHFIIDGLGLLNPQLAITRYDDLRSLIGDYREVARTRMSIIYERNAP